ncbi:hypothetical protein Daus18300_010095 [Diaporthe australafricana]|uniref:Rhodopsin domain-containing protein n=1 Tax=Diaporthe australafricana TaxID=127596 RepID=A0ABR3WBK1_9PEZI
MASEIANEPLQKATFIVAILGTALSILATVLRFIATKRAARKLSWEDWFAVLATLFFIAYVVPLLWQLIFLNGRSLMKLPMVDLVKVIKAGYVSAAQYCLQQLFAKLSLLLLYYRIFSSSRVFVRWVYFLGTVQVIWSIATYIIHYVECIPPQKIWTPTLPGPCIDNTAFLVGGETVNSLVDFALVGLAIWVVQSLQMKTSVKLKLAAIFAFGGL